MKAKYLYINLIGVFFIRKLSKVHIIIDKFIVFM